tara:strand:+ start:129 stop:326 length:198 start_codon:yes stop_codon:yes gene_type:complete
MSQIYTDETREDEPYALPNAEVFYVEADPIRGWYWWSCFAGCLPDSDAIGPFETKQEAINDARDY